MLNTAIPGKISLNYFHNHSTDLNFVKYFNKVFGIKKPATANRAGLEPFWIYFRNASQPA
ncbi:MAG: hypothetical protein A3K41_08730 [Chloroflexi bacterium RIFOXYD12_FULL_57_15]|nr:MAG: hypothetical protein A3K41_08730 [Chloroflexi bacterium RIFOXYD12_FULL_57_15]